MTEQVELPTTFDVDWKRTVRRMWTQMNRPATRRNSQGFDLDEDDWAVLVAAFLGKTIDDPESLDTPSWADV